MIGFRRRTAKDLPIVPLPAHSLGACRLRRCAADRGEEVGYASYPPISATRFTTVEYIEFKAANTAPNAMMAPIE